MARKDKYHKLRMSASTLEIEHACQKEKSAHKKINVGNNERSGRSPDPEGYLLGMSKT